MRTKRTMAIATGVALLATGLFAAPSVEITSVQQQYPWTNTVDIVYNVAGVESETNGYFVVFTPTTSDNQPILDVNGEKSVQVALKGSGVYSTQWFPQTNLQYTACKMTPSVFRGAAKDYMIVDLLTGAVTYEPMATQEASNQRYQATEYKTKKLVLRRIEGNKDYYIGEKDNTSNIDQAPNTYHKVNVPQDYYIAIYTLTEAQWNLITGASTDAASIRPKGWQSWNTTRGSALTGAIPTKGVMADLNRKTGLRGFDLPTESMYEIAARAGSTTLYIGGNTASDSYAYAWLYENGNSIHNVGLKLPNAWGIYDVVGNCWEFVRDVWNGGNLKDIQPNALVPVTTGSANSCVFKSCAHNIGAGQTPGRMRLSMRHYDGKTWNADRSGIRVSYFPQ